MTSTPSPGWFEDPTQPGSLRWWDGASWTTQTALAPSAPVLDTEEPDATTASHLEFRELPAAERGRHSAPDGRSQGGQSPSRSEYGRGDDGCVDRDVEPTDEMAAVGAPSGPIQHRCQVIRELGGSDFQWTCSCGARGIASSFVRSQDSFKVHAGDDNASVPTISVQRDVGVQGRVSAPDPVTTGGHDGDGCALVIIGVVALLAVIVLLLTFWSTDRYFTVTWALSLLVGAAAAVFIGIKWDVPLLLGVVAGALIAAFLFAGLKVVGPDASYWNCYNAQKSNPGIDDVTADLRCR